MARARLPPILCEQAIHPIQVVCMIMGSHGRLRQFFRLPAHVPDDVECDCPLGRCFLMQARCAVHDSKQFPFPIPSNFR